MKNVLALSVILLSAVSFFGPGASATRAQSDYEKREGFIPLFDAKDLSDWKGDSRLWSMEDGVIVGQTDDQDRHIDANTFLIYQKPIPSDFVLRFDYRMTRGGNSGVQYRSFAIENDTPFKVGGYQADFDGDASYSGMIYGENFRWTLSERGRVNRIEAGRKITTLVVFAEDETLKEKVKIEDWNTYEIVAVGFTFIHRINGQVMSVLIDDDLENRRADGLLAIQAHAGPPMKVEIKNWRIKEVK